MPKEKDSLDKLIEVLTKIRDNNKDEDLKIVDEFGDEIKHIKLFKDKVILSIEKSVKVCKTCGGPIYLDNKTSFKYACPHENINKYF